MYLVRHSSILRVLFIGRCQDCRLYVARFYHVALLYARALLLGMFIGGASGGTAGGIKLNTILVIFAGFRAFIQQRPLAKIGQMSISWEDVRRANILFISAILVVILATFALSITERVQEPFAIFGRWYRRWARWAPRSIIPAILRY